MRFLGADLKQHVGKVVVGKFKVPFVVELEQGRTVRMVLFQMNVVNLGLVRCVSALFANVNLIQTDN